MSVSPSSKMRTLYTFHFHPFVSFLSTPTRTTDRDSDTDSDTDVVWTDASHILICVQISWGPYSNAESVSVGSWVGPQSLHFLTSPGDVVACWSRDHTLSRIWRVFILCFYGYNFSFYLVLSIL